MGVGAGSPAPRALKCRAVACRGPPTVFAPWTIPCLTKSCPAAAEPMTRRSVP